MAINKFMMAALKAISYAEPDILTNFQANRVLSNIVNPPIVTKPLYEVWDYQIKSEDYNIPVRIFEPKKPKNSDIILFFHGGGWVIGNINSYTRVCAMLANKTSRRVFSVDYRLAPEFPFPYAVEDCYRVAEELIQYKNLVDPGNARIILMGDSAGGNIAAAVSLMARDRGRFHIEKQILLYPSTYNDHSEKSPFGSIRENGRDYLLTSKRICEYIELYIKDPQDFNSPYFAPLLAEDLSNQPETLIITAEFDPLRDEGEAYGLKLKEHGNKVQVYRMKNGLHGFFSLPITFVHVKRSMDLINSFLG